MSDPTYTRAKIQRDLQPHKPAVAAMWLYGERYSQQGGGSMTFWDGLTESEKRTCRELVARMEAAPHDVQPFTVHWSKRYV